ncbi:transposase [Sphingomonas sp.]|uniref:transposase n=1 Tax=Sphingomonas sp. TaxID=28214 RepID=UPI0035C83EEB
MARSQPLQLAADEFIRRFLIHVLPKGFHCIRHVRAAAGACSSSKPSNAGASPVLRRRTSPRPEPPSRDPAWLEHIPPRSTCASGKDAARAGDIASCTDKRFNRLSRPRFRPEALPDYRIAGRRGRSRWSSRCPANHAKTAFPIDQRSWHAASCLGGYRTPAGARFPSQKQPSRQPRSLPTFCRSSTSSIEPGDSRAPNRDTKAELDPLQGQLRRLLYCLSE